MIRVRKICRRPASGRRLGLFLLDGVHLLEEALAARCIPADVLIAPRLRRTPAGRALLERMASHDWPVVEVTDELLDSLAATDTPQGVLGLFRRPRGRPAENLPRSPDERRPSLRSREGAPLALVLAGVQDPVNLGVLARAAWVFGCAGMITLRGAADPFHPRALRASAGTLLRLQVAAGVSPAELLAWSAQEGVGLVGLVPRGGKPLEELDPTRGRLALVLGSEARGISPEIDELCGEQRTIAMSVEAESLGVAAAGTIALYVLAGRAREAAG